MSSISCVIPAYNEAKTIGAIIRTARQAKKAGLLAEIIVVSDGSTDRTLEEAKSAGADKVIALPRNIGKGGAAARGIAETRHQIILLLDADLKGLTVEHIRALVLPITHHGAAMAVGYLSDDPMQIILPQISGQRAFRKELFKTILESPQLAKSRYSFEVLLNRFANKSNLSTLFVPLAGLSHVKRRSKYGQIKTLISQVDFYSRLFYIYKNYFIGFAILLLAVVSYALFLSPIRVFSFGTAAVPTATSADRILVIAAHPDDEALGAAGYLGDAIGHQASAYVAVVTNGDANRWSAGVEDKKVVFLKSDDYIEEGNARRSESQTALKILGVPDKNMFFFGFPDRGLNSLLKQNWETPKTSVFTKLDKASYDGAYRPGLEYSGKNLVNALEELIQETNPNIVILHDPSDKNADHSALAKFSKIALDDLVNREIITRPKTYTFLVHYKLSEYPHPFRESSNSALYPPKDLKNYCHWKTYPLSKGTEDQKLKAIQAYKSQLSSPYLKLLLLAFVRTNELFCESN